MPRSVSSDVVPAIPTGLDPARAAAGRTRRCRVAQALFSAGGPLAAYPGPAAVMAAGELVLAANPAAKRLVAALMAYRPDEVRLAIEVEGFRE